jgi:type III pantothenate kinase
MNLIIDIGNTMLKIFLFEGKEISFTRQIKTLQKQKVFDVLHQTDIIENGIVSSVVELEKGFLNQINTFCKRLVFLDEHTKLPLINEYETESTLGKDRIAAVVGASTVFPETSVLVIDAGTALTFEFITQTGRYLGGNISPGLSMRFKALNYYTGKLPLLESANDFPLLGRNTNQAIIAGVQNGIIFEIDNYINELKGKYNDLKVILTGGDSFFFAHKLKNTIFAEPFLTAIGLNRILQYNVE